MLQQPAGQSSSDPPAAGRPPVCFHARHSRQASGLPHRASGRRWPRPRWRHDGPCWQVGPCWLGGLVGRSASMNHEPAPAGWADGCRTGTGDRDEAWTNLELGWMGRTRWMSRMRGLSPDNVSACRAVDAAGCGRCSRFGRCCTDMDSRRRRRVPPATQDCPRGRRMCRPGACMDHSRGVSPSASARRLARQAGSNAVSGPAIATSSISRPSSALRRATGQTMPH